MDNSCDMDDDDWRVNFSSRYRRIEAEEPVNNASSLHGADSGDIWRFFSSVLLGTHIEVEEVWPSERCCLYPVGDASRIDLDFSRGGLGFTY